eukprot:g25922.t1
MLGKLKGLTVDKSPRLDGLHPIVLKEIAEKIVKTLMVIFQESLESRRIPEDWKMSNGRREGGRRPETRGRLSAVAGKILESLIKDEIVEYLEVH